MLKKKLIISNLCKKLLPFIENLNEFFNLFNNVCILSGDLIMKYITLSRIRCWSDTLQLNIFCKYQFYEFINLFFMSYLFNRNVYDIELNKIVYDKIINQKKLVINVYLTNFPIAFLEDFYIFNIEKNYYNGDSFIYLYKKNLKTKYEKITYKKFSDNDFNLEKLVLLNKINEYVKYGYKIKIIQNDMTITFQHKFNYPKYIYNSIKYFYQ